MVEKYLKTIVALGGGVGMRIDWEGAEGTFWLMVLYFNVGVWITQVYAFVKTHQVVH